MPDPEIMISLRQVSKSFGTKAVLDGVNLSVRRGETMVIVGPSGTGKSVTLKHMVGLMRPDSGQVLIGDVDMANAPTKVMETVRRRFGVLFQSGALIAWMTVYENVALPLYEHTTLGDAEIRAKVFDALRLVQLEGHESKRPVEISGGMKKRAALARAIITRPDILLYDEPTSGLDPVMSRHVDGLITDMQAQFGVTSVVVTHDLHSAFTIGDQVAMLYQGQVIEVGSPAEFARSQHPFVRDFIKAQFATGKIEGLHL